MVIKVGTSNGIEQQRVLFDSEESTVFLPGARWFYPNGDGAGFYRFALDDGSLSALVRAMPDSLDPQERLDVVGNQWALAKAGKIDISQVFTVFDGLRLENDRAVLSAMAERLYWLDAHVIDDEARPAFGRFVERLYLPQFHQLGWEALPGEDSDARMRRATVIAALGEMASLPDIEAEARRRLALFLRDRTTLDPNLATVVIGLAARGGDEALYGRYLEARRAAGTDPEEEQRFLLGLTAFEEPALTQRLLDMFLTEEVRAQDRAHVLARLLGSRHSRLAAWAFVRDRWDELTASMDPMLQQNVVRGLSQVTPQPAAREICAFLPEHITDQTRETIAQAVDQLSADSATCARLRPEVTAALRERA